MSVNHIDIPGRLRSVSVDGQVAGANQLYDDDKTHPSLAGHYLAALCHFATVYGLSPIGIEYKPDGLPSSVAEKLQNVAYNAVFKKTVIEEEYLITKDMVEKELNDSGVFDTVIKFDN